MSDWVFLFVCFFFNLINAHKFVKTFLNLPLVTLSTPRIQLNSLFSFKLSCKWIYMKAFIVLFQVLGDSQEQSNLIYCSSTEIAPCS